MVIDCIHNYDIVDVNGDKMRFSNIDSLHGFRSFTILKNGEEKLGEEHVCYINGYKCHADEAKFGGIVISCFTNTDKRQKTKE